MPGVPQPSSQDQADRYDTADALQMDEQELAAATTVALRDKLPDPVWRLCNLYKILDKKGRCVRFRPNEAQLQLLREMWWKNIILKARQLGFTTFIQVMLLDRALFVPNTHAGVIAHRLEDCERILRDKIKFGYEQLPQCVRDIVTVTTSNESEAIFSNGSSVRVSTSMRSATLQILHISEMGKICAKNPHAAREIITGTLPAVDAGNLVFIESTAEGAEGEFYRMVQDALAIQQEGRTLNETDFKLHFFAWWKAPEYRADPRGIIISDQEHDYFDALEAKISRQISMPQRAWYIAKKKELGGEENMWQEYPSTPEEAFKVSMEGCYYTAQLAQARRESRILEHIPDAAAPVNTFWDLGADDATSIWLHQQIGLEHRLIGYYEASGEDLEHYVGWLQKQGYVYGTHYLPHDASHKRLGKDGNQSIEDMLIDLGLLDTFIVPRTPDKLVGIQQLRAAFPSLWFDETRCKEGLRHVELYRKEWDEKAGVWKSRPRHDEHSHGADALRALGQMFDQIHRTAQHRRLQNGEQDGLASERKKRKRKGNWRTA